MSQNIECGHVSANVAYHDLAFKLDVANMATTIIFSHMFASRVLKQFFQALFRKNGSIPLGSKHVSRVLLQESA